MVDDALRRKLVRLSDLRACHERIATGPGRRATVAMRAVLAERQPGYDPGGSDRELWVRKVLVAAGLPPPVQQYRVWVGSRWFDLDLAYPAKLVGLEFDGWDTHGTFTSTAIGSAPASEPRSRFLVSPVPHRSSSDHKHRRSGESEGRRRRAPR